MFTRTLVLALSLLLSLTPTVASANLGTVTAGVINGITINGTTINGGTIDGATITGGSGGNRVWINDGNDGEIHIGGSVKASAPFHINFAGDLITTGLSEMRNLLITNSLTVTTGDVRFDQELQLTADSPIFLDNSNFKGGNQFLCVNTSGVMFASATVCN